MTRSCHLLALTILGTWAVWPAATFAQTSYPMLMSIKPTAAQAGQTSVHTVNSRYSLLGAYQVLISGTGVMGEVLAPELKPEERPILERTLGVVLFHLSRNTADRRWRIPHHPHQQARLLVKIQRRENASGPVTLNHVNFLVVDGIGNAAPQTRKRCP